MKFTSALLLASLSALVAAQQPQATIYYHCNVPNTFAFTIDDGPTAEFPELLNALKENNLVATFYVNSNNLLRDENGPLPSVTEYIKAAYDAGHEIGSHTYSHACFTDFCKTNNPAMVLMSDKATFTEQIKNNEEYIFNAIGKYPTSYRAPFGDGQLHGQSNSTMLEWLKELGYDYVIHWDIETQDMENANISDEKAFEGAKVHYENSKLVENSLISLQHSIPVTVNQIIPWVANTWLPSHPGMKSVKVSECIGVDPNAMYRDINGIVTPSQPQNINGGSTTVSGDVSSASLRYSMISAGAALLVSMLYYIF